MNKQLDNLGLEDIKTISDIKSFYASILNEGIMMHPDDNFFDYINSATGEPTYSEQEATKRNNLLSECFRVCDDANICIYELMLSTAKKNDPMLGALLN
jgi:hypothetical protein